MRKDFYVENGIDAVAPPLVIAEGSDIAVLRDNVLEIEKKRNENRARKAEGVENGL